MAYEIERKFTVLNNQFKKEAFKILNIQQGYIFAQSNKVLRVRLSNNKSKIAIKYGVDIIRNEYEYDIPFDDAKNLLKISEGYIITKKRYLIKCNEFIWEVDEFMNENKGLIIAEIELSNKDDKFIKPSWIGKDVSLDKKYYNHYLSKNPFLSW